MAVQETRRCRGWWVRPRLARARSGRPGICGGKLLARDAAMGKVVDHGLGGRDDVVPQVARLDIRDGSRRVSDRVAGCPRWPRHEGLRAAASAARRRASSRWWVPRLVSSLAAAHFNATSMSSSSGACSRGLPKSRGTMTPWARRCDPKCPVGLPGVEAPGDSVQRLADSPVETTFAVTPMRESVRIRGSLQPTQLVRDRRALARRLPALQVPRVGWGHQALRGARRPGRRLSAAMATSSAPASAARSRS